MKKFLGWLNTIVVLVLIAGLLTGAVSIRVDASKVSGLIELKALAEGKATTAVATAKDTMEEAERAFARLDAQLWDYLAKGDKAAVEKMLADMNEEDRAAFMDNFQELRADAIGMKSKYTHILCGENGLYYAEAIHYLVTRTGNAQNWHTDNSRQALRFCVRKDGNEWKLSSCTEEENNQLTSLLLEKCDASMKEAYENGRNNIFFDNFLWLEADGVYKNDFNNNIVYAYQNEDGSVDVGVSFANGDSAIKTVNHISFELKDEKLGTILKLNQKEDVTVLPGTRIIKVYHFAASKVRKGTWTTVQTSSHIKY